jgi:lysophospholipase L1-like esterase
MMRGALVAVVLAAGVALLAEAALRVAGRLRSGDWPQSRKSRFQAELESLRAVYRGHPFLNTAPREGGSVVALGKSVALNSLGYRSPERPLRKPAGARRLVLAGGSTTFDVSAPSNAETWPYLLEARLGGVEVWNAGFPGWTSLESTVSFALRERDLEPEIVVLYHGVNDLQPAAHAPFDRQYERGHAELARRALGLELEPLGWLGRSLLWEWLVDRRGERDLWAAVGAEASAGGRRERTGRIGEPALAAFARNLGSAVAIAHDAGARVVVATQPLRIRAAQRDADLRYLEGWYPNLVASAAPAELERLNDVTRRLASARGLPLADVAADIAWTDADFADPFHYTASGREKLAAHLAARLTDSKPSR